MNPLWFISSSSFLVCTGRLNITYPMLFKLTNKNSDRMTHCGVLEFVADEGICYLPHWVRNNNCATENICSTSSSNSVYSKCSYKKKKWETVYAKNIYFFRVWLLNFLKTTLLVSLQAAFTFLFAADDAESPSGGRWSGPGGKC